MAKAEKTTKAPVTGAAAATKEEKQNNMAKARAARDSSAQGDVFTYMKDPAPDAKKLPPQAQMIVNTIKAAGKKGITRKELVEALPNAGLVTRQGPGRILSYYQKDIQIGGVITITAGKPAAPEETAK